MFAIILGLSIFSSFLTGYLLGGQRLSLTIANRGSRANILSSFFQSPVSTTTPSSSGISSSTISLLTSSSSPVYFYSVNKSMQYKTLVYTDACTLEKLSRDGWTVFQMGTVTTDIPNLGYESDCRTKAFTGIDWVLLEKER